MNVYIGADHRGFGLKAEIINYLKDLGHEVSDLGASSLDPNDDYPTFAEKVASEVTKNKDSRGVLLCGSGVGIDIAANKFDGIRASIGIDSQQVVKGREDDNMNVLIIAADFTNEAKARELITSFLNTEYISSEKHNRRLEQIKKIEENN